MINRRLLLGWIWALQFVLASADDITNWEQIITVKTETDCINVWTQDPNLSLKDPENVKPSSICPGDSFFSYNYKIWITSGFIRTSGEEKLVPKFQDSFTFPLGTSTAIFDSNYCLTPLPASTKQCAQFCNPRTNVPELNPYWLKRYDEGLPRDPATVASSDSFIKAKSCKQQQQQSGDQSLNIQSSEFLLQPQQDKALISESKNFPTPIVASTSNYFPLAGSNLHGLFQDGLTDFDTANQDSRFEPIPVDTEIGGSSSPDVFTGLGIRKRVEKLRAP